MDAVCQLYEADCLEVLAGIPADSFDACVTDPPYHLTSIVKRFSSPTAAPAKFGTDGAFARASAGFMGKEWDGGGVAFDPDTWRAIYRVLKPGGHMLVFGGTRTQHRMVCAIEDAGFEIRDTICWIYGTGFPKSLDVSKAIDRAAGVEREVVGKMPFPGSTNPRNSMGDGWQVAPDITAPASPEAAQWAGWGTALKPAVEMICLARKPLSEHTVAANVLRWGCGALNVDGCRVQGMKGIPASPSGTRAAEGYGMAGNREGTSGFDANIGRWPANLCHDGSDEVEAAFAAFGEKSSHPGTLRTDASQGPNVGIAPARRAGTILSYGSSGTASRFFYQAKANAEDRADSKHPTIKPLALMRYLCKLITPPGGTILDPFAGSGTTGEAALDEGFSATLIEREAEYCQDIRRRIG